MLEFYNITQKAEEGEEDLLLNLLVLLTFLSLNADIFEEESQQLKNRLQPLVHKEKFV